ncbi:MAG TPA: cell division protein FtsZ, partial [Desulfosporosinus sp.]
GKNRAADAAFKAIASPLLENSIEGAKGVLLNITGGINLTLFEVRRSGRDYRGSGRPRCKYYFWRGH